MRKDDLTVRRCDGKGSFQKGIGKMQPKKLGLNHEGEDTGRNSQTNLDTSGKGNCVKGKEKVQKTNNGNRDSWRENIVG